MQAEGILKYTHNDSVQCLAYNPVTQQLASGTASDFGLWSPEQKAVAKHKARAQPWHMRATVTLRLLAWPAGAVACPFDVDARAACTPATPAQVPSRVVCMAWTADGMLLALGHYDGAVSVRDKAGGEKHKFTASASPVWSLAWSPQVRSHAAAGLPAPLRLRSMQQLRMALRARTHAATQGPTHTAGCVRAGRRPAGCRLPGRPPALLQRCW